MTLAGSSENRLLPMIIAWCDFGHCSNGCWIRCDIPHGCWDGRPTNLYREAWKLRKRPAQYSLELEQPKEAA